MIDNEGSMESLDSDLDAASNPTVRGVFGVFVAISLEQKGAIKITCIAPFPIRPNTSFSPRIVAQSLLKGEKLMFKHLSLML